MTRLKHLLSMDLKDKSLTTIDINGIPTSVYSRVSLNTKGEDDSSDLILCIPGSPGVAEFYVPFADHLYNLHKGTLDVCVVSHAGHSPGTKKIKTTRDSNDWYSLQDQVDHKIAFVNQYYPRLKSLYLIGHSIGSHVALKMLDDSPAMKKCILLFPAIERFAETPNARWQRPFYTTFRWLAIFSLWLSTLLFPLSFRKFVLQKRFNSSPKPHRNSFISATLSISTTSLYSILCMADDEIKNVKELPAHIISKHHDSLVLYYGIGDRWNLPSFYQELIDRFPLVDVTLCSRGLKHAFILKSSNEVAEFCHKKLH